MKTHSNSLFGATGATSNGMCKPLLVNAVGAGVYPSDRRAKEGHRVVVASRRTRDTAKPD